MIVKQPLRDNKFISILIFKGLEVNKFDTTRKRGESVLFYSELQVSDSSPEFLL